MAQVATTLSIPDEQRPLDQIPISPIGGDHSTSEQPPREETQEPQLTVFHSPENFTVKHPLMNKWTLWFTKPSPPNSGDNWAEYLKEVVTFDSVEEFWGIYNNITKTSDLAIKSDYHLFKHGVRPEWEDVQNKYGGKWAYVFKKERLSNVSIDELWLHVMLAAIGETLEKEGDNEIMGVVVNVRRGFHRVSVWTRSVGGPLGPGQGASNRPGGTEILMEIGGKFKEVLRLPPRESVEFSSHTESARNRTSRANVKFSV